MKNKNTVVLLSCLFVQVLCMNCSAQEQSVSEDKISKKDAEAIKNNKMIVILLDEDKKYVDKITRKGETEKLKYYTETIAYYNNAMKELAAKYLSFPKEVDCRYFSEIKLMQKEERRKCSFFGLTVNGRPTVRIDPEYIIYVYDLYRNSPSSPIETESFHFNKSDAEYCQFDIYTYRKDMEGIFSKPIYHLVPTKADMIYTFMRANKLLEIAFNGEKRPYKKKEENLIALKEKILAIREDDLSKKVTADAIKKIYPCPFELLPKEKIDSIFIKRDEKYAVLMFVDWQHPYMRNYHQEIFDISTSNVIDNVTVDPDK